MSTTELQSTIEALWEVRDTLGPENTDAMAAVTEAIDLLDTGQVRVAEVNRTGSSSSTSG